MIGEPGAGDVPMLRNGYRYRILTAQGASARRRVQLRHQRPPARRLRADRLPRAYRTTGVMTFIVNHYGDVYEKNLGPDTATIAERIAAYCTGRELAPGRRLTGVTSRSGWRLSPDLSGLGGLESRSASGAVVLPS